MNSSFSLKYFATLFLLLSIIVFLTSEAAVVSRHRRAVDDYYNYQIVNNVVSDGLYGAHPSLGWAQVPHVYSPMFAPVFGG